MTGRFAGSNRVQVRLDDDGGTAIVTSSTHGADEVSVGDSVELELDEEGRPADWRRPAHEGAEAE